MKYYRQENLLPVNLNPINGHEQSFQEVLIISSNVKEKKLYFNIENRS